MTDYIIDTVIIIWMYIYISYEFYPKFGITKRKVMVLIYRFKFENQRYTRINSLDNSNINFFYELINTKLLIEQL